MTLKKCTVTQLDDVFWRVDTQDFGAFTLHIVRGDEGFYEQGSDHAGFPRPSAFEAVLTALHRRGLSVEDPTTETAEQRVRNLAAWPTPSEDEVGAFGVLFGDLRAVLAELGTLRESDERWNALCRAKDDEIDRLRKENADGSFSKGWEKGYAAGEESAQRPVDVDAVLAPVRECLTTLSNFAVVCAGDERAKAADLRYHDAGTSRANRMTFLESAARVSTALAEAEKIGRGQ